MWPGGDRGVGFDIEVEVCETGPGQGGSEGEGGARGAGVWGEKLF